MDLKDKVAIVTGSSSGIGKAIAIALGKKSTKVVVHCRNNLNGAKEVVQIVKDNGGEADYFQADLLSPSDAQRLVNFAVKKFGRTDILINNAGEYKPGDIHNFEAFEQEIQSILMSSVYATSAFLKNKSKSSRKIINISSMYGDLHSGQDEALGYSAAKAGLNSLTINLAKTYKDSVLVNAVAPGWTWTPNWGDDKKVFEKTMKEKTVIKRFIEAEEIAQMVLAILENDAVTGQIIQVEGGATLKEMF